MIFLTLFQNLLPLYVLIGLGWYAGRHFEVDRQTLANLAIYIFMPVMMFGFVAQAELKLAYALLPFLVWGIQAAVGLLTLALARRVYNDNTPNLLAMCTAMGNSGYFGLPLVILLFEKQWVGVYSFMLLGMVLYEASLGYYIAARGNFTARDSIRKLVRLPAIYALALGLALNLAHVQLPEQFLTYWTHFKGAYVVSGMMIIGIALARVERLVIGPRFLALTFAGKFVAWPAICLSLVALDNATVRMFPPEVHSLLLVLSVVPPAANIAAFAAQLNLAPEKAATTVLIGTVAALIYIPLALWAMGIAMPQ